MDAENKESCLQRDSAERKGYVRAHRSFNRIWKERDSAEPDILGKILNKDNLNRAYKRVKANKGAPGVDGMTIEEAFQWIKEHNHELTEQIRKGHYTPSPVRRVEIPKSDGGVRKLGIPTVIDRIIQQAMSQQLIPIYEPKFSDGSFGYRPGRSAKDAVQRIEEYAEQGYTKAVVLDLSKYFDTLNHELLVNILRRDVKDERVIQMIKRYLRSGVMENGVVVKTEEGSPQGGNLSPLLANVYLNEFDQEFNKRGVPCIRYADDIVLLAKSERASERLLESSTKYLEGILKLKVNREKSRTVSVFAIRNFKYLGFCFGKSGKKNLCPCPWKVMEESQGEAEKAHFPEQVRKYSKDHGTYKRIYARMAELLQYGRHEKQRRKAEQVVVSKDTNVYLETVETAKDTKTEADGVGNARMGSL